MMINSESELRLDYVHEYTQETTIFLPSHSTKSNASIVCLFFVDCRLRKNTVPLIDLVFIRFNMIIVNVFFVCVSMHQEEKQNIRLESRALRRRDAQQEDKAFAFELSYT